MEAAGLWPMKEYIQRRQANIAEYIANHPIYELYAGVEWMPCLSTLMWWWHQDVKPQEEGAETSEGVEREVG